MQFIIFGSYSPHNDDYSRDYVVVYALRSNKIAEANYSSYKGEALAAVVGYCLFLAISLWTMFILVTKHQPLR